MQNIDRPNYLDWLKKWQGQHIVKVISGVRRSGKSTLFTIFQNDLILQGVEPIQIISINFEDLAYEDLTDYHALYAYILKHLVPDKMNYIFLDEIQHVSKFEKVIDSLFLRDNCDVYITGSNAYFMSSELATLLTGRYVELAILPLSFAEFYKTVIQEHSTLTLAGCFNEYLKLGSFPYITKYQYDLPEAQEYIRGIYNTILLNDVVKRNNIADVNMLEAIARYVMHNIGNRTTPKTIANTMVSQQRKIDAKTVDKYLRALTDSMLIYEARRYNIKGKELLSSINKYYVCDIALRNLLVATKDSDIGHIIENIVYLELKRRGYEVYVGQYDSNDEVDFVAIKNGLTEYYQVSQTTLAEETLKRELSPLRKIKDSYPKYLLTLDEIFDEMNYDGIQKKNLLKWLLQ